MRVLIQLRTAPNFSEAVAAREHGPVVAAAADVLGPTFTVDASYPPVPVPSPTRGEGGEAFGFNAPFEFAAQPPEPTYLVRGEIPDDAVAAQPATLAAGRANVVGIFADPQISTFITCGGDPPVGRDSDVARLLSVPALEQAGLDGQNVLLAVVDTGINLAYLQSKGRTPKLDVGKSWTPTGVATKPGQHPVNHGTMCAFDAGIAAPAATLIDYAVLLTQAPGGFAGLLSDAVLAYDKLRQLLAGTTAARRALVVTNSWGLFNPAFDFPVGHPGNYSDNPRHPFNLIVGALEAAGADILFAAGNCGRDCPDGRCAFGPNPSICGANSHPSVLSIAGADTKRNRVGYSSQGPGRLAQQKPDITSYTHFRGSAVFDTEEPNSADSGTSAACPVAAGVIAAVRTKVKANRLSPAQLRALVEKTADDRAGLGFDFDYGWGIIDPQALLARLPLTTTSRRSSSSRSHSRKRRPTRRS
jgi:hypothetical protein